MFEASSKRAFNSTTTVTSFFTAASIRARTIGEFSLVRYKVCLIESTSGSRCCVNKPDHAGIGIVGMMQDHIALAQKVEKCWSSRLDWKFLSGATKGLNFKSARGICSYRLNNRDRLIGPGAWKTCHSARPKLPRSLSIIPRSAAASISSRTAAPFLLR